LEELVMSSSAFRSTPERREAPEATIKLGPETFKKRLATSKLFITLCFGNNRNPSLEVNLFGFLRLQGRNWLFSYLP
jgi:hypothetical protein